MIAHVPPGGMDAGQVVVAAKGPVMVTLIPVKAEDWLLNKVSVMGALVDPTTWFGNAAMVGSKATLRPALPDKDTV